MAWGLATQARFFVKQPLCNSCQILSFPFFSFCDFSNFGGQGGEYHKQVKWLGHFYKNGSISNRIEGDATKMKWHGVFRRNGDFLRYILYIIISKIRGFWCYLSPGPTVLSNDENLIDFGAFQVFMKNWKMKMMKNQYFLRFWDNLEASIELLRSKYVYIQSLRSIGENWKKKLFLKIFL